MATLDPSEISYVEMENEEKPFNVSSCAIWIKEEPAEDFGEEYDEEKDRNLEATQDFTVKEETHDEMSDFSQEKLLKSDPEHIVIDAEPPFNEDSLPWDVSEEQDSEGQFEQTSRNRENGSESDPSSSINIFGEHDESSLFERNYNDLSESDCKLPTVGLDLRKYNKISSNEFAHEVEEMSPSSLSRNESGDGAVQQVSHIPSSKNINSIRWKREKAAIRREAGKSYISYTGNVMPAKSIKMGILCHKKCRFNCTSNFDEEKRESILKSFYQLNVDAKNSLLFNNIEKVPIKRTRKDAVKHKLASYNYMVTTGYVRTRVCKKALANLYQISLKKIEIIQNKIKSGTSAPQPDRRGRSNVRPNKTSEDVNVSVKEHISKFPDEGSLFQVS